MNKNVALTVTKLQQFLRTVPRFQGLVSYFKGRCERFFVIFNPSKSPMHHLDFTLSANVVFFICFLSVLFYNFYLFFFFFFFYCSETGAVNHTFKSRTGCFYFLLISSSFFSLKANLHWCTIVAWQTFRSKPKTHKFKSRTFPPTPPTYDALATQPRLSPKMTRMLRYTGGINVSIYWLEMWISASPTSPPCEQGSRQHHKSDNLSAPLCIDGC